MKDDHKLAIDPPPCTDYPRTVQRIAPLKLDYVSGDGNCFSHTEGNIDILGLKALNGVKSDSMHMG